MVRTHPDNRRELVIIVSTDNGATFRPILKLATNGTIRETAEEGSNNISLHLSIEMNEFIISSDN
jgi:hypothetical protein